MGDVAVELVGNVAVITISSPEVRNGLTAQMGRRLTEICDDIDAQPQLGAVVLRGAGGTFCSGADRRMWRPDADQSSDEIYKETSVIYRSFTRVGELKVPSIAAVRGAAVGAGMNLLLATDLRVVADDARLISGFVPAGLHPGGGHITISARTAGREATAAMAIFGEEISGSQAAARGLAWDAVPDQQVEPRALELATRAAQDPELIREVVRSFRTELGPPPLSWTAAVDFERGVQMWSQRRRAT